MSSWQIITQCNDRCQSDAKNPRLHVCSASNVSNNQRTSAFWKTSLLAAAFHRHLAVPSSHLYNISAEEAKTAAMRCYRCFVLVKTTGVSRENDRNAFERFFFGFSLPLAAVLLPDGNVFEAFSQPFLQISANAPTCSCKITSRRKW